MNDTATLSPPAAKAARSALPIAEHIVEDIGGSGEGAQRCGQSLAAIAARMGNRTWTTEIIPAEIQPPARGVAGASGIRNRIGAERVTSGGDQTDLVADYSSAAGRAPGSRPRWSKAARWRRSSAAMATHPRWCWRRAASRTVSIRRSPRARSPGL